MHREETLADPWLRRAIVEKTPGRRSGAARSRGPQDGVLGRSPIPGKYRPFSPLHDRYNGFTLGTFLIVACHPSSLTRGRVGFLRRRVDEFLAEIGLEVSWPRRRVDAYPEGFVSQVTNAVARRSPELARFTAIGALSTRTVIDAPLEIRARARAPTPPWAPQLEQLGIPGLEIERWLRSIARARGTRVGLGRVLSHAAALLALVIESVPSERDSCFVSLPFRSPFLRLYETLYRPVLQRAGFRCIRAWGGLTTEEYAIAMFELVSRCGALLADITNRNVNVIHEVGLAHGMVRPVFLVAREGVRPPSNLGYLPLITYPRQDRRVDRPLILRLARRVGDVWNDYAARLKAMATDYEIPLESVWPQALPAWGRPRRARTRPAGP